MPSIKIMAITISIILFFNLYFQTFSDPSFLNNESKTISDVFNFHLFYPEGFILYLLTILIPSIYYGFIRGVRFHENALLINRGLPFFNMTLPYEKIEKYEVIHSKYFISITMKETEDDHMFTVNKIDRALAILDQQHIRGDLGKSASMDQSAHKKLMIFFLVIGVFVSLIQYSGFIRQIFR